MASLFHISLDELWKFATKINRAGWTKEMVVALTNPKTKPEKSLLMGVGRRLERVLLTRQSFVTPADVMGGYGCFICGSKRGVDELVLGYTYNLAEVSELFCEQDDGHHILICSTCRDQLHLNLIQEWLSGTYVDADQRWVSKQGDECPICRQVDPESRTLIMKPSFFDPVRWNHVTENGFTYDPQDEEQLWIMLTTCGQCRGEFLAQLGKWCCGEFLPEHRSPREWKAVELS